MKTSELRQRGWGREAHTAIGSLAWGRGKAVYCGPYHITIQISQTTLGDLFWDRVQSVSQLSLLMNNLRAELSGNLSM